MLVYIHKRINSHPMYISEHNHIFTVLRCWSTVSHRMYYVFELNSCRFRKQYPYKYIHPKFLEKFKDMGIEC